MFTLHVREDEAKDFCRWYEANKRSQNVLMYNDYGKLIRAASFSVFDLWYGSLMRDMVRTGVVQAKEGAKNE